MHTLMETDTSIAHLSLPLALLLLRSTSNTICSPLARTNPPYHFSSSCSHTCREPRAKKQPRDPPVCCQELPKTPPSSPLSAAKTHQRRQPSPPENRSHHHHGFSSAVNSQPENHHHLRVLLLAVKNRPKHPCMPDANSHQEPPNNHTATTTQPATITITHLRLLCLPSQRDEEQPRFLFGLLLPDENHHHLHTTKPSTLTTISNLVSRYPAAQTAPFSHWFCRVNSKGPPLSLLSNVTPGNHPVAFLFAAKHTDAPPSPSLFCPTRTAPSIFWLLGKTATHLARHHHR